MTSYMTGMTVWVKNVCASLLKRCWPMKLFRGVYPGRTAAKENGRRKEEGKLDNVKSQNYFSIKKRGKEKEVINYGVGTDEYPSF